MFLLAMYLDRNVGLIGEGTAEVASRKIDTMSEALQDSADGLVR